MTKLKHYFKKAESDLNNMSISEYRAKQKTIILKLCVFYNFSILFSVILITNTPQTQQNKPLNKSNKYLKIDKKSPIFLFLLPHHHIKQAMYRHR